MSGVHTQYRMIFCSPYPVEMRLQGWSQKFPSWNISSCLRRAACTDANALLMRRTVPLVLVLCDISRLAQNWVRSNDAQGISPDEPGLFVASAVFSLSYYSTH